MRAKSQTGFNNGEERSSFLKMPVNFQRELTKFQEQRYQLLSQFQTALQTPFDAGRAPGQSILDEV
jgi:hypothetical protein